MTVPVEPAPLMLEVPVFLIDGVVAVDDDGGAAAAHGNVTGEIGGGAVAEISARWRCHTVGGRNGVGGAVTGTAPCRWHRRSHWSPR